MLIKLLCRLPSSQFALSPLIPLIICIHILTRRHGPNEKHKGKGSKGRQLEVSDGHTMCTELQKYSHPLTSSSNHPYNTITGQVAVADINKHQADELGTTVQNDFIASHPGRTCNTISSKGKTTKSKKRKQRR